MSKHTELSSSVTVNEYQSLLKRNDRKRAAEFVRERFEERYFNPIESAPKSDKHGFASLAICCLVIETLESFYQGLKDTRGHSGEMFEAFFKRDTPLKVFGGDGNWFFKDIRCGILHQSETRNGWRILRKDKLLNLEHKTINATLFLWALREEVATYSQQLVVDDELWERFKVKMEGVCDNCG